MISRRDFLKLAMLTLLPEFWFGFSYAEQIVFTSWGQTSITFAQLQSAYETLS